MRSDQAEQVPDQAGQVPDQAGQVPDETGQKPDTAGPEPEYIVGIGASAGGLQALERFFGAARPDGKTAYVVIQHLSPDFKSMMGEILERITDLTVQTAEQGMALMPDTITLNLPRSDLLLHQNRVELAQPSEEDGVPLPINSFLESLAAAKGRQGVAVILSGTGRDGTKGALAVAKGGGLVLVQDLESALFNSMPMAAGEAVAGALRQMPEEMPETIGNYIQDPDLFWQVENGDLGLALLDGENAFSYLLSLLQRRYNVDFAQYKPQTLVRRLQRRMALDKTDDLKAYVRQAQADPDRLDQIYRDLLIDVTRFFRDEAAYRWLETNVIPQMVGEKMAGETLRVWSAACSTGAEAYSLAILFLEEIERQGADITLRLFATDLHPDSISVASAGRYSEELLEELPYRYREKYFDREGDRYRVKKELRQKIIFSVHNLLTDPHFTQQDMIVCRNMLIYVRSTAQANILHQFTNDLRPGGILFLGPSEHLSGQVADRFDVLSRLWRIFQRTDAPFHESFQTRGEISIRLPSHLRDRPATVQPVTQGWEPDLLKALIPVGFICDDTAVLKEVYGNGQRYLRFGVGRVALNLPELLPESLGIAVRNGLSQAKREGRPVELTNIQVSLEEETEIVTLRVVPFRSAQGESETEGLFLVLIEEMRRLPSPAPVDVDALDDATFGEIQSLKLELAFTRESLQSTLQELETANEELQSSNEELTAANEELQSTNEELSSVNEELYTVNAEYQEQNRVLNRLFNDTRNMLRASEVLVIFLDEALRLREITPACYAMFGLVETDIGRPISQFTPLSGAGVEQLRQLAEAALRGTPGRVEVVTPQGTPLYLNAIPYFGELDEVTGVVLNFVDLSEIRRAEAEKLQTLAELKKSEARYRGLIETQRELIARINPHDHTYTFVNPARAAFYGKTPEELIGHSSLRPENKENHAAIRARRAEVVRTKKSLPPHVDTLQHPSGEIHHIYWQTVPILDENGEVIEIQGVGTDITEQVAAQRALEAANRQINLVNDNLPIWISQIDREHRFLYMNRYYQETFNLTWEVGTTPHVGDVIGAPVYEKNRAFYDRALAGETVEYVGRPIIDGQTRYAQMQLIPNRNNGEIHDFFVFGIDLTELYETQNALTAANEQIHLINDNLPVWIATIDRDHRYRYLNRYYQTVLGVEVAHAVGRSVSEVLGEAVYRRARPYYERALAGERVEYRNTAGDQGQYNTQISLVPHYNDTGQEVDYFYLLGIDISDLSLVQQSLAETDEMLTAVTNLLPTFVSIVDEEHRMLYLNRYHTRLIPPEAVDTAIGRPFAEVLGPDLYETDRADFERVLQGEAVHRTEPFTYPDRTETMMSIHMAPYEMADGKRAIFVVVLDVEALKEMHDGQ